MNDLYLYRPRTDTNSKLWNKLRVDRDVVPVEPCEHGNYARHIIGWIVSDQFGRSDYWCPGAGIGGDDER